MWNKYGLENHVVVISGGTSGIGLAVADKLASDFASVFLLGRDEERGARVEQELEKKHLGSSIFYVQCDVRDAASIAGAMEEIGDIIEDPNFYIDVLINSAGIYQEQRLENVTEADYAAIFDTNVKGTLLLTQAAVKHMYDGGSIINIASDAGVKGNYGCPVYCASKGAIVALTRALALDLAPKIRVNCVCPADVATPLLERQLEAANHAYTVQEMAEAYPLGRIGRAEEVAHVICSLASPENSFMTGSIINVDGGITA